MHASATFIYLETKEGRVNMNSLSTVVSLRLSLISWSANSGMGRCPHTRTTWNTLVSRA